MYLITNRALKKGKGLNSIGKTPHPKGPNELRLLRVEEVGGEWSTIEVQDTLSLDKVKQLKAAHKLDIDVKDQWHSSLEVACLLFDQARREKKSILFFVHGYNNDIEYVLKTAKEIECLYEVIVVPFSWPANGGGVISGAASYLSDKSDAMASAGALNRTIGKIQYFHTLLTKAERKKFELAAQKKHPKNKDAANALYTKLIEKNCSVKISLLCHSMGNYVLEHTFNCDKNATSKLVFDNVCLIAADTNNEGHDRWINRLDVRKRLYVVINENDFALMASRIKPGDEQKARLGHYTKKLVSPNAYYVDLTTVDGVDRGHSYFKGESVLSNEKLKSLFKEMFSGMASDRRLVYRSDNNSYQLS